MSELLQGLSRHFTEDQLARLAAAHVGVAGLGGLGSNVALALARSGVRRFTLADMDVVDASNLGRQAYFPRDVGHAKTDALAETLHALDPEIVLTLHQTRLTAGTSAAIFRDCAIVIEALDDPDAKAMLVAALAPRHFLVCASGIAGLGGPDAPPMAVRALGPNIRIVGDFTTESGAANPPLAPRVLQAAAMQAEVALWYIVSGRCPHRPK